MATGGSPRRYAQAVFQLALERNEVDAWREYTQRIAQVFSDGETVALLSSRAVPFPEKERMLAQLLPNMGPLALNLAKLLVARDAVDLAPNIARAYEELYDSYHGIERAEAVTAVPLSPQEQEALRRELEAMTGKRVVLAAHVDPSIVGGLVVRVGGRILDGSVRSRLQGLKKRLEKASV